MSSYVMVTDVSRNRPKLVVLPLDSIMSMVVEGGPAGIDLGYADADLSSTVLLSKDVYIALGDLDTRNVLHAMDCSAHGDDRLFWKNADQKSDWFHRSVKS